MPLLLCRAAAQKSSLRSPQALPRKALRGIRSHMRRAAAPSYSPAKFAHLAFITSFPDIERTSQAKPVRFFMLALPIFPGRCQPSIVGASELNFCVRNGNRWTHTAISTNLLSFEKESKRRKLPYFSFSNKRRFNYAPVLPERKPAQRLREEPTSSGMNELLNSFKSE